mgnify:CR=1 FL=1
MSLFIRKGKLNNSGFSLVEVLVAIVILAIISLPVLSTFSNAARINAKARRTENANTAINNIVEEARIVSLDNLADGNGKYNYQTLGTSNNTYLVADKGQQYFTGVDGEKYFIRTKFNSNPYNSNANAAAGNKKTNNDINSAGLSVYADITASNSYVYRDDSADTEAIKYFSDLNKTAVSRTDISKTIDVTISIKEKSSNHFTQDISVNVTYKYIKEAGKYPDYTARSMDMVTWEFPAHVTGSGTSAVYTISGELKNNAKNMYIFYVPYQGEAVSGQPYTDTITEAEMTSDSVPTERININYDYPSTYSLTSTDHIIKDVNVYLFEMEKVVNTATVGSPVYKRMGTNMSNVYINGIKAISSANGTTPVTVYSNIKNWGEKNSALTKHINNKDVLYQMTVDVWLWKDVEKEIDKIVKSNAEPTAEKITTLTTTKED